MLIESTLRTANELLGEGLNILNAVEKPGHISKSQTFTDSFKLNIFLPTNFNQSFFYKILTNQPIILFFISGLFAF